MSNSNYQFCKNFVKTKFLLVFFCKIEFICFIRQLQLQLLKFSTKIILYIHNFFYLFKFLEINYRTLNFLLTVHCFISNLKLILSKCHSLFNKSPNLDAFPFIVILNSSMSILIEKMYCLI